MFNNGIEKENKIKIQNNLLVVNNSDKDNEEEETSLEIKLENLLEDSCTRFFKGFIIPHTKKWLFHRSKTVKELEIINWKLSLTLLKLRDFFGLSIKKKL
jgi:hypothetical protein